MLLIIKYLLVPGLIAAVAAVRGDKIAALLDRPGWRAASRALLALLGALLTVLSVVRYATMHSGYFDLGNYEAKIGAVLQGHAWSVIEGHWAPILLAGALPYAVYPSGVSLIVLQSILLLAAGLALKRLGETVLGKNEAAQVIALCFMLHPAVQYGWLFDFHPDAFYPLLIFLIFLWLETGNKWGCRVAALLATGTKESLTLCTGLVGCCLAGRPRLRRYGLMLALVSLAVFILYATLEKAGFSSASRAVLGYLGDSPADMGAGLVGKPLEWIATALGARKLFYLWVLSAPLALVFVRAPVMLIPALPLLFISLMSRDPAYSNIHNHYALGIIPFLFLAGVYGLARIADPSMRRRHAVAALLLSAYFSFAIGALPYSLTFWEDHGPFNFADYRPPRNRAQIEEAIQLIPPESTLTFQSNLYLHAMIERPQAWVFPDGLGMARYVLLDQGRAHFVWDKENRESYEEYRRSLQESYLRIYAQAGVELYRLKQERPAG
ncbi:MAG: DUF2079 domain-containing protein [Acidobacteria bacterium]|nr:DUF2079 domain-containing protein [Acidobacteriota bacterium]